MNGPYIICFIPFERHRFHFSHLLSVNKALVMSGVTCWCLHRHLCDLPWLFSEIDELSTVNHKFVIHPIFYANHHDLFIVGKRRFSALKWYLVC